MPGRLLPDRIDELQGAVREPAFIWDRIDPYGEELRAQVAFSGRLEIEIACAQRIAEVEVLVDEALRGIGMGVNNDRGLLNLFGREFTGHLGRGLWRSLGKQRDGAGKEQ